MRRIYFNPDPHQWLYIQLVMLYAFHTDTDEKITNDAEIQTFGRELVLDKSKGGCGFLVCLMVLMNTFHLIKEIISEIY
jgi:hypothetical protein